jgi:hypothetical protein
MAIPLSFGDVSMPLIELHFPVLGAEIPADHGYALYGAMSRLVPRIHTHEMTLRIGPIRGSYIGNGKLRLEPRGSRLHIRLQPDDLPVVLPLAGKSLDLDGHAVRLGVPQVSALVPATTLFARTVVIKASSPKTDPAVKASRDREKTKRYQEPGEFLAAIRREFERQSIGAEADLPLHETGPRAGQACRHVLRIHGKTIVGFSLIVQGLTAEESLTLQEQGLGGRSKMGCGFFVPCKGKEEA